MRIQVSDIDKSENFDLTGHEAPILGLSLDPKDEFVVIMYTHVHVYNGSIF